MPGPGAPLAHVIGIAIGRCEARAVVVRREGSGGDVKLPELVASESGARSTPAVIALSGKGEYVVGEAAVAQIAKNPKSTVADVLGALPRAGDADKAAGARARCLAAGCADLEVADGGDDVAITLRPEPFWDEDGEEVEPPPGTLAGADAVAKVLGTLKRLADDFLGVDGGDALCCVLAAPPEVLGDAAARALLEKAAKAAKLDVLQFVDEAAAVACFAADPAAGDADGVVVLDVGGRGAAVAAYARAPGGLLAPACFAARDAALSGDAFTEALYGHSKAFLKRRQKIDVDDGGRRAQRKLRLACLRAARVLEAGAAQADVEADALVDGVDARVRMTRARFDDLTSDAADGARDLVAKAAGALGAGKTLLLVAGGASRAAPLRKAALGALGESAADGSALLGEPDEAAAFGAAKQAALLAFGPEPPASEVAARQTKGKRKVFTSTRADFQRASAELPRLDKALSVVAARGSFKTAEDVAAAAGGATQLLGARAPVPARAEATLAAAGDGALFVCAFAGGAPVAALDASALGDAAAVAVVAAISETGALTLTAAAGGKTVELVVPK